MIDPLLTMSAHLRKRLTSALESGVLVSPYPAAALRSILGNLEGLDGIAAALFELGKMGIAGRAAGVWIRTSGEFATRTPKPDLVWSGPEAHGLNSRNTRRVYEEILSSARRSVWASTYVFFDGPRAFEILAGRMDSIPGLQATLLLNIQRKWGDTTSVDQLVRKFADHFWRVDWPGSSRPRFFYDPRALDPERPGGVLHAKAVVTDDETVFVTSANLTEAALDRNIELGLLVRDRSLALSISSHFRGLIEQNLLKPLPMD